MFAKTIDIQDENVDLEKLLILVREGAEITLVSGDQPIALLTPLYKKKGGRVFDLHPGAIEISDDFNDPLPDEFWLGES